MSLGRREGVSRQAYVRLKNMILHLDLIPGQRIPEEKIAAFTGGSRTPVREAIRQLAAEGLVNIYPRRFAEVARYDEDAIREIGAMRLTQDMLAARLAIKHGTGEDFDALDRLAQRSREAAHSGNVYDRIACDSEFHLYIYEIGGNRLLLEAADKTYLRVHLIQISKYADVPTSLQQIRHHQTIVRALRQRDFPIAAAAICDHLGEFYQIEPEVLDMYRQ